MTLSSPSRMSLPPAPNRKSRKPPPVRHNVRNLRSDDDFCVDTLVNAGCAARQVDTADAGICGIEVVELGVGLEILHAAACGAEVRDADVAADILPPIVRIDGDADKETVAVEIPVEVVVVDALDLDDVTAADIAGRVNGIKAVTDAPDIGVVAKAARIDIVAEFTPQNVVAGIANENVVVDAAIEDIDTGCAFVIELEPGKDVVEGILVVDWRKAQGIEEVDKRNGKVGCSCQRNGARRRVARKIDGVDRAACGNAIDVKCEAGPVERCGVIGYSRC